ncbi:MAG: CPBP family intramembrane metalloprotease [Acidobacteriales bacterium]|nr:CPBP family intramembrane metalloprotease [Terriglobales bacterium]
MEQDANLIPVEVPPDTPVVLAKAPVTPVASYIHTAVLVLIMLGIAALSAIASREGRLVQGSLVVKYIQQIAFLWTLAAVTAYGLRLRGVSAKELMGRKWKSFDDFLFDVFLAGCFWIGALLVMYLLRLALGTVPDASNPNALKEATKALAPLIPRTGLEMGLWVLLSLSAGFCEEFVFRGYLQRQFTALTRNAAIGIVLSAAVFGAGHTYQGAGQGVMLGVFGAMLGLLAYYRKSIKPGIIAHAWQDICAGLLLSLLLRIQK